MQHRTTNMATAGEIRKYREYMNRLSLDVFGYFRSNVWEHFRTKRRAALTFLATEKWLRFQPRRKYGWRKVDRVFSFFFFFFLTSNKEIWAHTGDVCTQKMTQHTYCKKTTTVQQTPCKHMKKVDLFPPSKSHSLTQIKRHNINLFTSLSPLC